MKTWIYGYNNCITITVYADNESEAYIGLKFKLESVQHHYSCQLPDLNCFDLITCF